MHPSILSGDVRKITDETQLVPTLSILAHTEYGMPLARDVTPECCQIPLMPPYFTPALGSYLSPTHQLFLSHE
jgi:hypothetical protein